MRLRVILPVMLAIVFALGACGSSGPSGTPGATTGKTSVTYEPAGAFPSKSAKMVCETEVEEEIASALGMKATRVTKPTWRDHVYSCSLVYPKGSVVLSTKELVDEKSTTDYFNGYKTKLGVAQNLYGLGQGAFIAKNNDVVVRKDYKVLLVDVQHVPQKFVPAMTRQDVATNIAAVIMSCWVGA
jgi:hypothetical protein